MKVENLVKTENWNLGGLENGLNGFFFLTSVTRSVVTIFFPHWESNMQMCHSLTQV